MSLISINPNYSESLIGIASIILNDLSSPIDLRNACHTLLKTLDTIHSIDENRSQLSPDLVLTNGKAVNALSALHCIIDYARTTSFIRGVYKAIKDQQKIKPGKKIHLCYAGTGPYAPLILPSILQFTPDEVEFTLMEIIPETYYLLQKSIETLGISPWIKQSLLVDGTQFQFEEMDRPDIILSETMQLALRYEMQVPLTINLCPQLAEKGVFIPQNINVSLGKLDQKTNSIVHKIDLINFGNLNGKCPCDEFEIFKFKLSDFSPTEPLQEQLYFFTEIDVYKNERLTLLQSGLTMPLTAFNPQKFNQSPVQLNIQYKITDVPGFYVSPIFD
ncbi:MAG: hypothetical protein KA340_12845 [Saprospiraceae bacterium]|jgi:hypothetical protein|nr:hypothetical protein [Saprospiraceae bacterium]